jgi:DNA mismatch repair protein MutS2
MANSSARVLEFELLRDLLRGYATSDLGRARVSALEPSVDVDWIQNQQRLTTEIRDFRRVGGSFEFAGLIDVSQLLDKSRIAGAVLEALEIRDVINIVDRAAEWREIAFNPPQGMKSNWAAVRELSSGIADFADLLRGLRNKILPDGTLDDKASPQLANIRREIEKQRR